MVYVDTYSAKVGRMRMCHMLADSTEELLKMADTIGIKRKWIQKAGTVYEHFDICYSKKVVAVRWGAKLVGTREMVEVINRKRASNRA